MNVLRIALGQVNPTVGDLEGNARLIRQAAADAAAGQADLLILPEMVLTGYPVEDLSLRPS
ncbi:MAG: nitrilase-related carbon-nitrogen hydrolase, partial [Candidatus Nanopelagicales bacterium]